jgi:putative nucleotidyltransferase with HDIG domain
MIPGLGTGLRSAETSESQHHHRLFNTIRPWRSLLAGIQLKWSFFRSKLARRIFLMFVACTLLPIAALFVLSFRQVTRQLDIQNQKHLDQSVAARGSMIKERLLFLETDLRIIAGMLDDHKDLNLDADHFARLTRRFKSIAYSSPQRAFQSLLGGELEPLKVSAAEGSHLQAGRTAVRSRVNGSRWPQLVMIRFIRPRHLQPHPLIAEINPSFLWSNRDQTALSTDLDFCVFNGHRRLLFSTLDMPPELTGKLQSAAANRGKRLSRIQHDNEYLQVCQREMGLNARFLGPEWTLMVIQPESAVVWPISQFRYLFVLVTLMTFLVVLLLSINMIRRSLTPLERLKERTRRIARKDFSGNLDIRSGDEFEELAKAFNDMSDQLKRQFNTLVAKSEIDRAILSSIETEKIVQAVLTGMRTCMSYDAIRIILLDTQDGGPAQIYTGTGSADNDIETNRADIPAVDLAPLSSRPDHLTFEADQHLPTYLGHMGRTRYQTYMVLPIFLKEKLAAMIAFGFEHKPPHLPGDLQLARQMADQAAVALANSQLMDELNRLNWGTIKALARAVDAKSSWTAGHSERVAAMAVAIGTTLQLPPFELEELKRAGLLHDIGKLGVPASVLDKPGKLTAEEYRMVQRHPGLGASILQPIRAYADIISMVRHHHENFDGSGYPDGLAGDDIELGARILAVADVFDALKSDRPYRRGLPLADVIDFMYRETHRQFDPLVVEALMRSLNKAGADDHRTAHPAPKHRPGEQLEPKQRFQPSSGSLSAPHRASDSFRGHFYDPDNGSARSG